jgi:hypothetical protein
MLCAEQSSRLPGRSSDNGAATTQRGAIGSRGLARKGNIDNDGRLAGVHQGSVTLGENERGPFDRRRLDPKVAVRLITGDFRNNATLIGGTVKECAGSV